MFGVSYRMLKYFRGVEELGPCSPASCSSCSCSPSSRSSLLSNVITALSTFFLAKDLDLLVSAPVDWLRLYLAKLAETMVHSSWMVGLIAVPILTAYGIVYRRRPAVSRSSRSWRSCPFLVLPAVIGSALHAAAGELLPRPPHPRPAVLVASARPAA